jgi:Cu/Ag efflux protein CusF
MMPLGAAMADETMVKGEVTKVSPDTGKLTIEHDPIKKFDMDSMTMVWKAADPAMLDQVKPGDKVLFHPDKVNGQFTVTKIEKAK